jgi:uncharacterized protein (DUF305 family)
MHKTHQLFNRHKAASQAEDRGGMHRSPYHRLFAMIVLSFLSMYVLMSAMVDSISDVYPNVNQAYMAGLMTAPMVLIEILLMGMMYENKRLNTMIAGAGIIALVGFFLLIRQQTAVSDIQFLKSMIPHHSGAILMCNRARLQDAGIKELCRTIISGQQTEIAQTKAKLKALGQ